MGQSEDIIAMAKANNGIVTTQRAVAAGIMRGTIKYLVEKGVLEKSARGVYMLPDAFDDEFVNLQARYKRGVFSRDTSLYLTGLLEKSPEKFHMTFPTPYNLTSPKEFGVVCNSAKEPYYSLGITELKTPGGNTVRGYNAERSICDALKTRYLKDQEVLESIIKRYSRRFDKNIPLLKEYAEKLSVEKRLAALL